jgi:hypothetical protein
VRGRAWPAQAALPQFSAFFRQPSDSRAAKVAASARARSPRSSPLSAAAARSPHACILMRASLPADALQHHRRREVLQDVPAMQSAASPRRRLKLTCDFGSSSRTGALAQTALRRLQRVRLPMDRGLQGRHCACALGGARSPRGSAASACRLREARSPPPPARLLRFGRAVT